MWHRCRIGSLVDSSTAIVLPIALLAPDNPLRAGYSYDFWNPCATLLLCEGVHPKLVQELLGHASINITLDTYSHVLPGMGDELAVLESYATECSSRDYYASVLPANVYVCSNWRGCSS